MSGPARHCYHGVPRVIEDSFAPDLDAWLETQHPDEVDDLRQDRQNGYLWQDKEGFRNNHVHAVNYLKENRLNLTFR